MGGHDRALGGMNALVLRWYQVRNSSVMMVESAVVLRGDFRRPALSNPTFAVGSDPVARAARTN